MPITIKDIARMAGVSHATVSQVLNNKGRVSALKRAEILDICEKENYIPNQVARSLQEKRTKVLGVIVNFFGNPFIGEIINGIENIASFHNYVLLFGDSRELPERESMYVDTFLERRVDGIIIYPTFSGEFNNDLIRLNKMNIPYVLLDKYSKSISSPVVACDDFKGGCLAVEHLIGLHHKKIGIVLGPTCSSMNLRQKAYKKTLAKYHLPYIETFTGHFEITKSNNNINGYAAALRLLSLENRPTALFVTTDEAMPGVFKAIRELNLKVPDDVAIVSYGNMEAIVHNDVPLTTVNYPQVEVGEEAMKMLLQLMDEEQNGKVKLSQQQVFIAPELVIRKSCGS